MGGGGGGGLEAEGWERDRRGKREMGGEEVGQRLNHQKSQILTNQAPPPTAAAHVYYSRLGQIYHYQS